MLLVPETPFVPKMGITEDQQMRFGPSFGPASSTIRNDGVVICMCIL